MKKLFVTLGVIFLYASPALAFESLGIGSEAIIYNIPDGYVLASGEKYDQVLAVTRQAMPENIVIHRYYVPRETDEAFRKAGGGYLDRYLFVSYDKRLQDAKLTKADFKPILDVLLQTNQRLVESEVKDKINESITKASDGAIGMGELQIVGAFRPTDTSVDLLALMSVIDKSGVEAGTMQYGVMATLFLANGKLVTVNQYQHLKKPEDLDAFKEEAPKVFKSMNFPMGASPASDDLSEEWQGGVLQYVLIAVIAAAIIFLVIRRRKRAAQERPKE